MKLKDLRIGTQMKMSFSVIVILIVVLGIISWQQTEKIATHTLNMYNHPLTVTRMVANLNKDIMSIMVENRNLLLSVDENSRNTALSNSRIYEVDAERQLQMLSERYLGPKDDIIEAQESFTRWVETWKQNYKLVESGKVLEAIDQVKIDGAVGRERENLIKSLGKIVSFVDNKATEYYQGTTSLKDTLNQQLVVLLIVILLLMVLIIYYLDNNINTPITELASVTKQFKEGSFSARSFYQSKNEFGHLSSSFNNLADTIETELKLNDQAANLAGIMLKEDDAHNFCHAILSSLLEYTDAQLGAFYFLNAQKTAFDHFDSVGMEIKACHSFSATLYEGEFGTALSTQRIQHIIDIPEETPFLFSTVSGKFKPREIITIPIVSGNEVVAFISLATIKRFNGHQLRLINTILNTLSARIDGILAYQKAVDFAKQLEFQNKELEMQKKELSMQTKELTGQNIELEMQKKQLDEANKMKTSFLSNMSHELRTPLNSVIALSGVLNRRLNGKVPDEEHGFFEIIERNGKQLLRLINDILDLSRIESGYEEVEIKKINIDKLIDSVVEMIKSQAMEKGIYLRYTAQDNIPEINSDYYKCYHILQNLISNALKFTEVGGVDIKLEVKEKTINVIINDTGIGIEKEHIAHIFDEFKQADSSNSRKYGGTGLGLAIAKKYVKLLGGNIEVESTPGKGSTFVLVLPINDAIIVPNVSESKNILANSEDQLQWKEQAKDKTILLVEDTEAIIIQMKDMLTAQGYTIAVARNGAEALEQIGNKVPDAMILDLMMPEVDGFEVLKRVREQEKAEHLPVIILTAKYVTKQELAFLKNNGIIQLIQKGDIDKDQLLRAVNSMMTTPEVKETEKPVKKQPQNHPSDTPRVMVVEDNADNMLTIKVLLKEKYQIIEALDGRSVTELALEHRPHLILMDIALPGKNGIDALADLRKVDILRPIPVIAISASAMKGAHEDFIAHGFDDYISKPIDSVLFEKIIKQYVN